MKLKKIVSGGQTGVDRAARDAAFGVGLPCGGWVPGDRMAEDGMIPDKYPMTVLPKGGCRAPTRLTRNLCALLKRPHILIYVSETPDVGGAAERIMQFVEENKNVECSRSTSKRMA